MTVSVLYNEAFFFRNKQMEEQGKGNVDVQFLVERPHVYILARCGSSEVDQLAYINTRKECMGGLENQMNTSNEVKITDVVRLFHGDGPHQAYESGGNGGSSGCSGDARR